MSTHTTTLGKDLVGLEGLDAARILAILDTAEPFKEVSERVNVHVAELDGTDEVTITSLREATTA